MTMVAQPSRRWWTLALLAAACFIATIDIFIVNVAAPSIQKGIAASNGELQIIVSVYSLFYGVLIITSSRLGDRYGRRKIFLLGVLLFTGSSALCSLATSPAMLIGFRMLQGIGAAGMVPQVLPTLHVLFHGDDRQRALGVYGAAIGLGMAVGQVCGGALIEANLFGLGWRLIFLFNIPIGVAIAIVGPHLMEESQADEPKRLDSAGVVILTAALVLSMLPPIAAGRGRWEPWMMGMMGTSLLAWAIFVWLERSIASRGGSPLVDITLFRSPAYTPGVVALALAQSSAAAFMLIYALHMQLSMGFSALAVGATMVIPAIGYTLMSLATGALVKRWGGRIATQGSCLVILGNLSIVVLAAVAPTAVTPEIIVAPLLVSGIGRGLMLTPTINAALRHVRTDHIGMASGVLNTLFQVANLVGVAIIGSMFFAVRDLAPGSPSERSMIAFAAGTAAIAVVSVLSLVGVWRAQQMSIRAAGATNSPLVGNLGLVRQKASD